MWDSFAGERTGPEMEGPAQGEWGPGLDCRAGLFPQQLLLWGEGEARPLFQREDEGRAGEAARTMAEIPVRGWRHLPTGGSRGGQEGRGGRMPETSWGRFKELLLPWLGVFL